MPHPMNLCSNLEIHMCIIPGAVQHIFDIDMCNLFKIHDFNKSFYINLTEILHHIGEF